MTTDELATALDIARNSYERSYKKATDKVLQDYYLLKTNTVRNFITLIKTKQIDLEQIIAKAK